MRVGLMATPLRVEGSFLQGAEYFFEMTGGNTGNLAFVYALYHQLGGESVAILPWYVEPEYVRERADILVIACANQLGAHTNLAENASRLAEMKLPIVAIGLGAQADSLDCDITLTAGTRRWIDVIADCSPTQRPNIGVRGVYTLNQLSKIGLESKSDIVGCPSNFINPNIDLGNEVEKKFIAGGYSRIAIAAGLPGWEMLRKIEQSLIRLMEDGNGEYIVQSELDMMRLARRECNSIGIDTFEKMRDYMKPELSTQEFTHWCKVYAKIYGDADSWMERMGAFDFVVGARFHGVNFAIQAGIPGGVIAHDSRTTELCSTMGIPYCDWNAIDLPITCNKLKELFPFDGAVYTRTRSRLANAYCSILADAGIEPARHLRDIAAKSVDPQQQE